MQAQFALDDEARDLFHNEARVASALCHPNIVSVVDFGDDPDWGLFITMELLDGESLFERICAEPQLPIDVVCYVAAQLAGALAHAHASGVVHGDVKIVGRNHAHLDGCIQQTFGAKCKCSYDEPRLTSPILDQFGKRMHEDMYDPLGPKGTGEARALLGCGPGSEIPVMSGKTYRLNGPRHEYLESPGWSKGSIWVVYVEPEPEPEPPPRWWQRIFAW